MEENRSFLGGGLTFVCIHSGGESIHIVYFSKSTNTTLASQNGGPDHLVFCSKDKGTDWKTLMPRMLHLSHLGVNSPPSSSCHWSLCAPDPRGPSGPYNPMPLTLPASYFKETTLSSPTSQRRGKTSLSLLGETTALGPWPPCRPAEADFCNFHRQRRKSLPKDQPRLESLV